MPSGRVADKVAVVVGAGQTPGDTIGNGRAISLLLAREGATVVAVDLAEDSALETAEMIRSEGGTAHVLQADVTSAADCARVAEAVVEAHGRIDILVNNVGIGTGDSTPFALAEDAWDRIHEVNLKGMWLMCKSVLPKMQQQRSGAVVNVSSAASVCATPFLAYKTSKAGVNALTHQLAMAMAPFGVRVNAVLPGLLDTPMAISTMVDATGIDPGALRKARDSLVPLGGKQGTAWDTAHAVLYLASDEAKFVTGVCLPVDGGQSAKIG